LAVSEDGGMVRQKHWERRDGHGEMGTQNALSPSTRRGSRGGQSAKIDTKFHYRPVKIETSKKGKEEGKKQKKDWRTGEKIIAGKAFYLTFGRPQGPDRKGGRRIVA